MNLLAKRSCGFTGKSVHKERERERARSHEATVGVQQGGQGCHSRPGQGRHSRPMSTPAPSPHSPSPPLPFILGEPFMCLVPLIALTVVLPFWLLIRRPRRRIVEGYATTFSQTALEVTSTFTVNASS